MKTIILLHKEYDGEQLCDLSRDIYEAFDSQINPISTTIPKDNYNIHKGKFKVSIIWEG